MVKPITMEPATASVFLELSKEWAACYKVAHDPGTDKKTVSDNVSRMEEIDKIQEELLKISEDESK